MPPSIILSIRSCTAARLGDGSWHRSCFTMGTYRQQEATHASSGGLGSGARHARRRGGGRVDRPAGAAAGACALQRGCVGAHVACAGAGPVRAGASLPDTAVSLVPDRVHGLHDRRDARERGDRAPDRSRRRRSEAIHGDARHTEADLRGRRMDGYGGRDPQSPHRRALLVFLPRDAGGHVGRPVVRPPALSRGRDHVR